MFIIQNSDKTDIEKIFKLYKDAVNFQKTKASTVWPEFDKSLIETEIKERRQWKMMLNDELACVWATTFSDPQIWEERNIEPAVYIHRIATNPDFRGRNLLKYIIAWAKEYALKNDKVFVRMDTIGNNTGLIDYYSRCGFNFLGLRALKNTEGLPTHYKNATVSLFEIKV